MNCECCNPFVAHTFTLQQYICRGALCSCSSDVSVVDEGDLRTMIDRRMREMAEKAGKSLEAGKSRK